MTKKQKCFELLDKQGHIYDQEAVDIFGGEKGIYLVWPYIRMWKSIQRARNFFKDKKITEKYTGHRAHYVKIGRYSYKVPKDFYDEVVV